MIASMTGFGRTKMNYKGKNISIEIKSLNSKHADISIRLPNYYREKESEIRDTLVAGLQRGKIDFAMFVELTGETLHSEIHSGPASKYIDQMIALCRQHDITPGAEIVTAAMQMPEVMQSTAESLDAEEWKIIDDGIRQCVAQVVSFREHEGAVLGKDLLKRIMNISQLLMQVDLYEAERIPRIKERLMQHMNEMMRQSETESGRLEQELIYYIEKLDITEEKIRLQKHCDYFTSTIESELQAGRKLGFICQEIGREINTLGSKANHSEIQMLVVQMKDELEKIKEQLLNIL